MAAAQNGLDHDARLIPFVPSEWVVPALAYLAAERIGPGRVVHLAGDRMVVPAGDAEARLAEAVSAGLVVRGTGDMRTAAWRKLLGNLVANPITALTLRRIGVMDDPGIADLARGLLLEAVQVGRAEGARLDDEDVDRDPGRRPAVRRRDRQLHALRPAGRPAARTPVPHRRGGPPGGAPTASRSRSTPPSWPCSTPWTGAVRRPGRPDGPLAGELAPALQRPAQGELVGVLQVPADRQPAGDTGHLDRQQS